MLGDLFADTRALAISSPIRVRIDRAVSLRRMKKGARTQRSWRALSRGVLRRKSQRCLRNQSHGARRIVATYVEASSRSRAACIIAESAAARRAHGVHATCFRLLGDNVRACVLCWEERRQRPSEANDGLFGGGAHAARMGFRPRPLE